MLVNKKAFSGTFNINIVKKILDQLYENGRLKRTNLSGKTGLNYNNCIKYTNLLKMLGWIAITYDSGCYIIITQKGKEILDTLYNI
jgi:predicted transcriptional regulator